MHFAEIASQPRTPHTLSDEQARPCVKLHLISSTTAPKALDRIAIMGFVSPNKRYGIERGILVSFIADVKENES